MQFLTNSHIQREGRGRRELWNPPHHGKNTAAVGDQAPSFRTRCHTFRQEVALAGSQQLRAKHPAPVRRCRTEGRTGPQGREEGNEDEDGDGNENEGEDRDGG